MLCPPFPPLAMVENWLERHRRPLCFAFHVVGIPPTVVAVLIAPIILFQMSGGLLLLAVTLFVGGYVFQFVGHWLEGSEPGEVTLLKRLLPRLALGLATRRKSEGTLAS